MMWGKKIKQLLSLLSFAVSQRSTWRQRLWLCKPSNKSLESSALAEGMWLSGHVEGKHDRTSSRGIRQIRQIRQVDTVIIHCQYTEYKGRASPAEFEDILRYQNSWITYQKNMKFSWSKLAFPDLVILSQDAMRPEEESVVRLERHCEFSFSRQELVVQKVKITKSLLCCTALTSSLYTR